MNGHLTLADHAQPVTTPGSFAHWLKIASAFAIVAVAVWLLYLAREPLLVVISALMLAVGLDPLLDRFEKRRLSRSLGMATAMAVGLIAMGLAIAAIGPVLIDQLSSLSETLPRLIRDARETVPFVFSSGSQPGAQTGDVLSSAVSTLGQSVSAAAGFLLKASFVLVLAPYLAVSLPNLIRGVARVIPHQRRPEFLRSVNASTKLVGHYILGNVVVSLLAGVITFIGLTALNVQFALALAVWVALVDAVPAIGATLGAIPAVFVAASGGLGTMAAVVAFFLVYQQIENHLIVPNVMRKAVSLGPATVLIAILIGGTLAGALGVLLAIPLTAMLKVVLFDRLMHDRIMAVRNGDANEGHAPNRWWRPGSTPGTRPLP
ncbi:MAG: AI-2E family transporter [Acidimicrobiia bacterium]